jgi:twitching motility two-component system response regulator PilH
MGLLSLFKSLLRSTPPPAPSRAPSRPSSRPSSRAAKPAPQPAQSARPPRPAPAPESAEQSGTERRRQLRVNAREGTRVMIVDDSKTILAALCKFLRSAGYETFEALDAESALAALPAYRPALIFLDIMLPGINGFAALRAIRRDPATNGIPVILMSSNEKAMEQFFSSRIVNADDFMKKPFTRKEVFFRIERLLDSQLVPRRAVAPVQSGERAAKTAT